LNVWVDKTESDIKV